MVVRQITQITQMVGILTVTQFKVHSVEHPFAY